MTSNPFYILTILTSSYLAFFSWVLIVEISIVVFKIKNHRIRSSLHLLPFFSLLVDILFKNYSLAQLINPLSCASCVQKLFLEYFYPQLTQHLSCNETSLITYLGTDYQHNIFSIMAMTFAATSIFFASRYLFQTIKGYFPIRALIKNSSLSTRPIQNISLARKLSLNRVSIYISNQAQIPFAAFNHLIIIPQYTMEILSQDEFEAVLAHELEHLLHKDSFARLFYYLTAILFWWVPTRSWITKIENEQELACDQNALNYGLHKESLAAALYKVTKQLKISNQPLCYLTSESHTTTTRIKTILGFNQFEEKKISRLNIFFVALGCTLLLTCLKYY